MSSLVHPSPAKPDQPLSAPPPSKVEIERKLSYKSAASPKLKEGGRRARWKNVSSSSHVPPAGLSGNDSDTSSVHSAAPQGLASPNYNTSPIMSAAPLTGLPTVGGLAAISERHPKTGQEIIDEEMEEEDAPGDGGSGSEAEDGEPVVQDMEGERVLRSGFLFKKQEKRKVWKKKWFVLRTGKLAYYKDEREYALSRVIELHGIQTVAPVTVKKNPFSFGIVTSKRTFFVKALSQEEMEAWVNAINGARQRLAEREEEDRLKREGGSKAIPVPTRQNAEPVETHPGAYSSVFTNSTVSSSPITSVSSRPWQTASGPTTPGIPQREFAAPTSPMINANTLDSQMAQMSLSKSAGIDGLTTPRLPSHMSSRREPSSSPSQDYFTRVPSGAPPTTGVPAARVVSSDEDEAYFSDPATAFANQVPLQTAWLPMPTPTPTQTAVDPNKVILSTYLMKRSKGRGRRVWRKRWFILTSQGVSYSKSHMDHRTIRTIPLASVLDALELDSSGGDDDPDSEEEHSSLPSSASRQTFGVRREPSTSGYSGGSGLGKSLTQQSSKRSKQGDHLFRLITSKRTYVLCAPSEEDEIKWIAAFRALLNRERGYAPPSSPTTETAPRLPIVPVPMITAQPPTPASSMSSEVPSMTTSQGPPVAPNGLGLRGRSATYTAKNAVADVVRRYHPEQEGGQVH